MKKGIALVHPLGKNWSAGREDVVRLANVMPPHGLMMLAAVLERHGFDCEIVDAFAHPKPLAELVTDILQLGPAAVGVSTTTSSFPGGYAVAEAVKAARPEVTVVFGGVHPTSIWRRILEEFPAVDAVVVGEGEETLLDLARNDWRPAAGIPGLAFRTPDGGIEFGGPRPHLRDLDSLPHPAYGKLRGYPKAYPLPIFNYPRSPATTFISSRGCPYSCSYCDRSVFGSSFRPHSPAYMVDHLAMLKSRYGIRHVNIYDDNFLMRRERLVEFAELLLRRGLRTTFNCIGRADGLDADLLRLMKRAGCWMINVGVESGDQATIAPHRTNSDLDVIREVVARIRTAGIRCKGLFMMGIPGETEESAWKTIRFAVDNPFNDANLTKFTPFPGAPIYRTIREHGTFVEDWEKMNCMNFVFVPNGFALERLEEIYAEFYRRFFGRHAMLPNYASLLWESPESWMRLLANLPTFLAAKKSLENPRVEAAP